MSTETYETTIQRAKALIAANIIKPSELAHAILPGHKKSVAHIRLCEWLRGPKKMSDPQTVLRFSDKVAELWSEHGRKKAVRAQLVEA